MASRLHQLEISFQPNEDRLLLKIYTQDFKEIPIWLTRRLVKSLWYGLQQLVQNMEKNPEKVQQETKKVTKQFEKEQEQKQPAAKQYATTVTQKPLSEEPLLVTAVKGKPVDNNSVALSFDDNQGKHIEMIANSMILLSLSKLISEAVRKADWDLKLELDES